MGTVDDFTVPQPIDENLNITNDWDFKNEWNGKDNYVFVIYNPLNPDSVITWNSANPVGQATELSEMFEKSPDNVHYFFLSNRTTFFQDIRDARAEFDLVLFPSSLFHGTIPFNSDEERHVIAFDIVPV